MAMISLGHIPASPLGAVGPGVFSYSFLELQCSHLKRDSHISFEE